MKRKYVFLIIFSCLWRNCLAQATIDSEGMFSAKPETQDRFGFYLDTKKSSITIPFQLQSNLILVPVHINNSDTLWFILDTGVSTTIVTDPQKLKGLLKMHTRKIVLNGAGNGVPLEAGISIDNELRMAGMHAKHHNIIVLEENMLDLSGYVGVPVHGIFGYEIFQNFTVTINFSKRQLTLTKHGEYRYKKRHGEKYPIMIEDTKPTMTAMTLLADGREKVMKLTIDTGAGHALLLDHSNSSVIRLPDKLLRAQLGRGLNGVVNGSLGRIDAVRFGGYEMDNVIASFPDTSDFFAKWRKGSDRDGNVGCEMLRRFNVTLNYQEGYMVLKPVRRRLREKFEHDMSGLELKASGVDLKTIEISYVLEGSPAQKAGLVEGDHLMYLNDKSINELTMSEIVKILQTGDGKEIGILAKRRGSLFFTQIKLRRMI